MEATWELPALATQQALGIISKYSAGTPMAEPKWAEAVAYQARRAQHIAKVLAKPGVLVLNDPVGTGKTVVALTAARLLLSSNSGRTDRVDTVVVVAPDATIADTWARRAARVGLSVSRTLPVRRGDEQRTHVISKSQLLGRSPRLWTANDRARMLLIVDEAHRGLQSAGMTHARLSDWAQGAHVLLVTATPFQLRPSGVERMLEIDGDDERADAIRRFMQTVTRWLTARHDMAFAPEGARNAQLTRAIKMQREAVEAALETAAPQLQNVLMPAYDRAIMRMPAEFKIPDPDLIEPAEDWLEAYHAARLLPTLLSMSDDPTDQVARNSDTYMRMLTSSLAAWQDSSVYKAAKTLKAGAVRALLDELNEAMGCTETSSGLLELRHPKVERTAKLAVDAACAGNHVLIFCVFVETQQALAKAIRHVLDTSASEAGITVETPATSAQAKKMADASPGFRNRPGKKPHQHLAPIIVIGRDNMSESIDLDGGRPVVIHHDLAWSPVRWTQRMGRVVRASSGFRPPAATIIPVLDTAIDRRMYETLKARKALTGFLKSKPELRSLLEEALPDWQ